MTRLGPEAARPLDPDEIAALNHAQYGEDGLCVIPVPKDAGLPNIKNAGRSHDHRFAYLDATGALLGCVLRWDARDGAEREFRPVTFWENGKGRGSWRLKTWPGQRPLFGLDLLAKHPDAIVLLVEGEKAAEAIGRGPLAAAF
jgi:hypothetical protein